MPKETEREISTQTQYITRDGKIYKKTITYSIVGNATFRVDDDTDPNLKEFRDVILNKDEKSNKDGYIAK